MSEVIVRCAREGALNSTSIMINSSDLEDSLKLLEGLDLRTSLHFNIAEGKAVTPHEQLQFLAHEGVFCRSFEAVVFHYYLGNKEKKRLIKQEIKRELHNQIHLYMDKLNTKQINLDSHQHYHTIPFVVDILLELQRELQLEITYVRVPKEPFFIDLSSWKNLKNYFGLNIIKHLLLNFFSKRMMQKLQKNGIVYNDACVGVLFTGDVTLNSVKKAFAKIEDAKIVELLFHPGYLSAKESSERKDDKFKHFYTAQGRKHEMGVLLLDQFQNFIKKKLERA